MLLTSNWHIAVYDHLPSFPFSGVLAFICIGRLFLILRAAARLQLVDAAFAPPPPCIRHRLCIYLIAPALHLVCPDKLQ
ncbi:hypothetical protein LY78DRAFT_259278 [Colletotrichum sublineola]|nr:hypothetical protein LY78DRAFT_259278 [Colletotrichum sublineola]